MPPDWAPWLYWTIWTLVWLPIQSNRRSAKPGASAPQIAHSAIANGLRLPSAKSL